MVTYLKGSPPSLTYTSCKPNSVWTMSPVYLVICHNQARNYLLPIITQITPLLKLHVPSQIFLLFCPLLTQNHRSIAHIITITEWLSLNRYQLHSFSGMYVVLRTKFHNFTILIHIYTKFPSILQSLNLDFLLKFTIMILFQLDSRYFMKIEQQQFGNCLM